MKEWMPYIVSIITALISTLTSLLLARKEFKREIAKLVKQHELDLEKEREKYKYEKEKLEIEHEHKIELMQKESENKLGENAINMILAEAMKTPEFKQTMSQGLNQSKRKRDRK